MRTEYWFVPFVFATRLVCAQPQPAAPVENRPTPGEQRRIAIVERMRREEAAVEKRGHLIKGELSALDRSKLADDDWAKQWAGTYYTGDGMGTNVSIAIAPKSGLAYTNHGCLGLYDANHGDIVGTFKDGIQLKLVLDPASSDMEFLTEKLYFVPWGTNKYLVSENSMLSLVNSYNGGGRTREWMMFIPLQYEQPDEMRRHSPEPPGRPKLPSTFAKLILDKPTTFKIMSVGQVHTESLSADLKISRVRIILDAGSSAGAFVGMEIPCNLDQFALGPVRIESVQEQTCEGSIAIYNSDPHAFDLLKPGIELTLPGAKADAQPSVDELKSRMKQRR